MEYGKRILRILKEFRNKKYYVKNYFVKNEILIFDDIMPSILSPWRAIEFEALCHNFKKVKVLTDLRTFDQYNKGLNFNRNIINLKKTYPNLSSNITKIGTINNVYSKLIYFIFFSNTCMYYEIAEENKTNFAFTLYPGGGFLLNHKGTDEMLKKIFSSKFFKGVIVNQFHVKDYLISKNLCEADKVHLIFGVPMNTNISILKDHPKDKFESNLNIVFFANKYIEKGKDKGFDVFQQTASLLIKRTKNVIFHVIGNFDANDLEDTSVLEYFNFYGVLTEIEYVEILKKTNIILCPNKPFVLHPNSFDGFPLATCIEASLNDNVIMATDYFNESSKIKLVDNRDFMLVNSNPSDILEKIIMLDNNRNMLKKIAMSGKERILDIYSIEKQIKKRTQIFEELLADS
ncbi:glycosyltransferase family 4 protein [Gelidibacter salicanalis]|uniref:Glycosyltransferase family 4 protein n=1 Tax=Gelidibacter salicanalis TaxID=291193 RepID=A0A5C7AL13_9FLAO|nr:glycosyltransferase family 4 protein [Gelidibacter salicanalis]TXE09268.1 glycosyltransferase family 4 protein [Gelidibacter salicanalis]